MYHLKQDLIAIKSAELLSTEILIIDYIYFILYKNLIRDLFILYSYSLVLLIEKY